MDDIGTDGGVWIKTRTVLGPWESYLFLLTYALALVAMPLATSALPYGLKLVVSLAWTIFQIEFHVTMMSLVPPDLPKVIALRIARTIFFLSWSWTTVVLYKTIAGPVVILIPLAIIISVYTYLVVLEGWFHSVFCIHCLGHIVEDSSIGTARVMLVENLVSVCFRCEEGLGLPHASDIEDDNSVQETATVSTSSSLKACRCIPEGWRLEM